MSLIQKPWFFSLISVKCSPICYVLVSKTLQIYPYLRHQLQMNSIIIDHTTDELHNHMQKSFINSVLFIQSEISLRRNEMLMKALFAVVTLTVFALAFGVQASNG